MKFCAQCGSELEKGVKFCPDCGATLQETKAPDVPIGEDASPPAPTAAISETQPLTGPEPTVKVKQTSVKRGINLKPLIAVVVIAVLAFAAYYFLAPSKYNFVSKQPLLYGNVVSLSAGKTYVFDDGVRLMQHSTDGAKVCVLTYENELFYCDMQKYVKIAEDVASCLISKDGSAVAFYTDMQYMNGMEVATLRLYNTSDGKTETIAKDVPHTAEGRSAYVSMSPDGKVLGYIYDIERESYSQLNIRSTTWRGGVRENLPVNSIPGYISNNKKYIYYAKYTQDGMDATFNVDKGKDTTRLVPSVTSGSTISNIAFNRDYSQMLFTYDGRTFISRNAGERERVASVKLSGMLLPAAVQSAAGVNAGIFADGGQYISVNNFANTCFFAEGGIYRIDKNYEARRVISSYDEAYLTQDGNTIIYSAGDKLYKIDSSDPNTERVELAEERIRGFAASSDGKAVYYINNRGELFYVKNNGVSTAIRTDERISAYVVPKGSSTLYFVDDGMLYSSDKGASRKRVSAPESDDVDELKALADGGLIYRSGSSVYRSDNGKDFKLINDDTQVARLGDIETFDSDAIIRTCQGNQRVLGSAQAMHYAQYGYATPSLEDLIPFTGTFACPSGGTYYTTDDPYIWACSIESHRQPAAR